MKIFEYGGRTYTYDECSKLPPFVFELGRYDNAYHPEQSFCDHELAIQTYEMFDVSNGYKKRLKLDGKIIAKKLTSRE